VEPLGCGWIQQFIHGLAHGPAFKIIHIGFFGAKHGSFQQVYDLIFRPWSGIRTDAGSYVAGYLIRCNWLFSALSSQEVSSVHSFNFGSAMSTDFKDMNWFNLF